MKKMFLALTTTTVLLALSGCLPKTSSSSSGGSTSSSPSTSNWWITATPTPTATYNWYTPTVTPTATATATAGPCNDPLGDCSTAYPVINLPILKRGATTQEGPNTYNSWTSSGIGFTTDGRLRLRIAVNPQPTARSSCGLSGSYNPYFYTKLRARVAVKLSTGAEIWAQTTDPVAVNSTSSIMEVPVASFPSAYPYTVTVSYVNTDSYCQYQTAANGSNYCNSHQAWCGCPADLPDPTNCWSLNLHVVTSQTNNFK